MRSVGGIDLYKFAADGDTSCSSRHLSSVFPSFAHMGHRSRTCWHIRHPFPSSSITATYMTTSPQTMSWELSLRWSTVIACAVSASCNPFPCCRGSLRPYTENFRIWNTYSSSVTRFMCQELKAMRWLTYQKHFGHPTYATSW